MLSNFSEQIFSFLKRGKREENRTTMIESSKYTNDDLPELNESRSSLQPLFPMSGSNTLELNYEFQPKYEPNNTGQRSTPQHQQKQTGSCCHEPLNNYQHYQCHIEKDQNKLSEISIFRVYLSFVTLFVCTFTLAVLLFVYINRSMQLHDSLKSEFVARSDIDDLVQTLLRDLRNNDDNAFDFKSYENDEQPKIQGHQPTDDHTLR